MPTAFDVQRADYEKIFQAYVRQLITNVLYILFVDTDKISSM